MIEFNQLGLDPNLLKGISEAGFVHPMPIQALVFTHSLIGEDIFAQSQTGSGKTAAFLISIFHRIMSDSQGKHKKALILAPTRELAIQIEAEANKLGKYLPISIGSFIGGVSYTKQNELLRKQVQIIIGTPGRISDFLQRGALVLRDVGFLVIDEADRMFDMGFINDIRKLLRYLPQAGKRQSFLFSATLGLRVKDLAWEYMQSPKELSIEPENKTVTTVAQELYHVGEHEKFSLLLGILQKENPNGAIIFCNQKHTVEKVARRLKINGADCDFIIGDLVQSKRSRLIERLKSGKLNILVATDVAARGLDIENLNLVINYDVPEYAESYVHRIGRTARAGKSGKAITLACERFVYGLKPIEKFIGKRIPVVPFDSTMLLHDHSASVKLNPVKPRSTVQPHSENLRKIRIQHSEQKHAKKSAPIKSHIPTRSGTIREKEPLRQAGRPNHPHTAIRHSPKTHAAKTRFLAGKTLDNYPPLHQPQKPKTIYEQGKKPQYNKQTLNKFQKNKIPLNAIHRNDIHQPKIPALVKKVIFQGINKIIKPAKKATPRGKSN